MSGDCEARILASVLACDSRAIVQAVEDRLSAGQGSNQIAAKLTEAMRELGQRWQRDEVFLPEVMLAAEGMNQAMASLAARLPDRP